MAEYETIKDVVKVVNERYSMSTLVIMNGDEAYRLTDGTGVGCDVKKDHGGYFTLTFFASTLFGEFKYNSIGASLLGKTTDVAVRRVKEISYRIRGVA